MAPLLSVVIPIYNEEQRLPDRLNELIAFLDRFDFDSEVILVDDGSTDATPKILAELASGNPVARVVTHPANRGKGAALKTGSGAAEGEVLLWTDLDLSTPIEDLARLWPYLSAEAPLSPGGGLRLPEAERGAYAIAFGSRAMPESELEKHQPWYRELFGKMGNLAIRTLLPRLWGIRDTQCGFKLLNREVAVKIHDLCIIDRWGFDFEALNLALLLGYRVREVPVRWKHMEGSKVSGMRDYLRTLRELWRVRVNAWLGRYRLKG